MSSFYNISIPSPDIYAQLQFVAKINLQGKQSAVFWRNATRQVVIRNENNEWLIQPDGLITASLAALFNVAPHNIIVKGIFITESPHNVTMANEDATLAFYECEWSDYACDKMSLSFDLEIHPDCSTAKKQLVAAIRAFIKDEEEYADMPPLIPVDEREVVMW